MESESRVRQQHLVGQKIRELRKERRLTQSELATRVGIQQSDLSRMEKGEYRVSLDTLVKVLAQLEMGFGEFFGEVSRDTVTPRDLELLNRFKALPRRDQAEIEVLIDRRSSPLGMGGGAARQASGGGL